MPCFEQVLTASKYQSKLRNSCFGSVVLTPWCTLWSSDGLCTSQISGLHSPDFPIWWPGVQSYLTHHSGSMLMSWLWDSYLEKIKCVHWGRIPSVWQSLQLTEAQRQKICEFLNGCFFWTILKRQDCVSLLFGVRFIIFRSITLIGHLSKLTKEMEFKIAIFHYRVFTESCTWQHGKAVEVAPVPEGTSWTQENQMEDVHVLKLLQH